MKVYAEYPVMVVPGVARYETVELDMTVEQISYLDEDIKRQIVINNKGCFICVKSKDVADRIAMTRKTVPQSKMIRHINNLISLVTMTVDELHRGEHSDPIKAMEQHLRNNSDLYGDVLKEVVDHAINCVCTIKSRSKCM